MADIAANKAALTEAGFNADVAEALAENDHTPETARMLSSKEIFDIFLEWNGIIGFGSTIRNALDNIRNMEAAGE